MKTAISAADSTDSIDSLNIKRALALQCVGAHSRIDLEVEVDGARYKIQGTRTSLVEIDIQSIELMTKDSTPWQMSLAEDAESNFSAAARQLVQKGKSFYTDLRHTWESPAYLWKMVSRVA